MTPLNSDTEQRTPSGTVLTRQELENMGVYDTGRKLGCHVVHWGPEKGVYILEDLGEDRFKVYINAKDERK